MNRLIVGNRVMASGELRIGANMYSAAEIGLKRDILDGDNTAELRPYHGDAGGIPLRGRDNAADMAHG